MSVDISGFPLESGTLGDKCLNEGGQRRRPAAADGGRGVRADRRGARAMATAHADGTRAAASSRCASPFAPGQLLPFVLEPRRLLTGVRTGPLPPHRSLLFPLAAPDGFEKESRHAIPQPRHHSRWSTARRARTAAGAAERHAGRRPAHELGAGRPSWAPSSFGSIATTGSQHASSAMPPRVFTVLAPRNDPRLHELPVDLV